jgi:hypothetical protein
LFYIDSVPDEPEKIKMCLLYPVKAELLTPEKLSSLLRFKDAIAFNIVEKEGKHFATSITKLNNDPAVIERELPPDRRECDIFLRRGSKEEDGFMKILLILPCVRFLDGLLKNWKRRAD